MQSILSVWRVISCQRKWNHHHCPDSSVRVVELVVEAFKIRQQRNPNNKERFNLSPLPWFASMRWVGREKICWSVLAFILRAMQLIAWTWCLSVVHRCWHCALGCVRETDWERLFIWITSYWEEQPINIRLHDEYQTMIIAPLQTSSPESNSWSNFSKF